VSLLHVPGLPTIPPPPTPLAPRSLLHATRQRRGLPGHPGPGFALHSRARRTTRPYRVHLRCGLVVHLQLLPTPSREDAVTFSYRPESACLKRTCTSRTKHTCRRTSAVARHRSSWAGLAPPVRSALKWANKAAPHGAGDLCRY